MISDGDVISAFSVTKLAETILNSSYKHLNKFIVKQC